MAWSYRKNARHRNSKKDVVRKVACNKARRKTKNEMVGWRVHGPEKDGNKRTERQSKGSRGLEAYCKGGQGPPRAVAPSKKKKGRYQHFPADLRPTTSYSVNEKCFINSVATIFSEHRLKILPLLSMSQIIRQSPRPFVAFLKWWFSRWRDITPISTPKATDPPPIG